MCAFASDLPRSYEAMVRGRRKLRVGQIVYVAFSADGDTMGFAFPKEERQALVDGDPGRFALPRPSEMRFNWVEVRLATVDTEEVQELVLDAWRMVVPKKVWTAYAEGHGRPP